MITKERLEETIRGVIREFKRTKRIPDPTADELAAALEAGVDDLFDQESTFSYRDVGDSAHYVDELRDGAQLESAEEFLREIRAWQETSSLWTPHCKKLETSSSELNRAPVALKLSPHRRLTRFRRLFSAGISLMD